MKVSHVLYKTNNLKTSFKAFEKLGFNVEYGSIKKPHNALIYFSHFYMSENIFPYKSLDMFLIQRNS